MTRLVARTRLVELEPLLAQLLDAADAYDMASLTLDRGCGIHGAQPVSNVECTCRGTRYTAVEFVQALESEVSAARLRMTRPAGQPNRKREGELRMSLRAG